MAWQTDRADMQTAAKPRQAVRQNIAPRPAPHLQGSSMAPLQLPLDGRAQDNSKKGIFLQLTWWAARRPGTA